MLAMPFALLSLGLALNLALRIKEGAGIASRVACLLALALAVGSLRAINTWDFPTYLAFGALAVLIGEYAGSSRRISVALAARVILQAAFLYWATTLLFAPFIDNYRSFADGVFLSRWQTPLYAYLGIHSVFIFLAISFLAYAGRSHFPPLFRRVAGLAASDGVNGYADGPAAKPGKALRLALAVGLPLAAVVALALSGYATVAFLLLLLAPMVALGWRWAASGKDTFGVFALAMLATALSIGIMVEVVTIKGDIARMNTVFKFYLQAWVLMGVASAYLLWRLGPVALHSEPTNPAIPAEAGPHSPAHGEPVEPREPRQGRRMGLGRARVLRWAWAALLAFLLIGSSVYTVAGTQDRLRDRFQPLPLTLNGMAYMEDARYSFDRGRGSEELKDEYDAIQWLRGDAIQGSPVVLEGQGELYRSLHGRVSIYTGLPTVLGWDNHQSQQRGYGPVIGDRIRDIRRIYSTENVEEAMRLLGEYRVEYVYIGEIERHYYPERGLDKFSRIPGAELAYSNPTVEIYRVASASIVSR